MKFRLTNKKYLAQLELVMEFRKTLNDDDALIFIEHEVYLIAKASGLRSKKRRHIVKRFRLVMKEAINELVNEYKKS